MIVRGITTFLYHGLTTQSHNTYYYISLLDDYIYTINQIFHICKPT